MLCYNLQKDQFFSNKKYLMQYTAAKRRQVPGCINTSRRYFLLLILIAKLERCFLNTRRGPAKFPVANYVTFARQAKSVVVRLSVFQGHSLIIKALDYTTYLRT